MSFEKVYSYTGNGLLEAITDGGKGVPIYSPTYTPGKQLGSTGRPDLGTFVYDGADGSPLGNRLTRVDPPPGDPEAEPHVFGYDGRGNQDSRSGPTIPGGEQSISYNVFNLPELITTGTGAEAYSVAFDYDASGQRVHTLRPDKELWHFGGIYEQETDPTLVDGPVLHRYSVFAAGQRVAQVTTTVPGDGGGVIDTYTQYFHYDRLGSVIALSSESGSITAELDYDVYGAPKQPLPTAYGYTGHRHEQDLGLVDAGGRFYDPVFGVFLSADPISPLGGSSPRLNRYAYVGYDPVNFTDPTGFFVEDAWNAFVGFAKLYYGYNYILPLNLVTTGRLKTTWDSETTEGAVNWGIGIAAGAGCALVTANPVIGAMCAGATVGAVQSARSGASWQEAAVSITRGALFGGFAGGMGHAAGSAVFQSTESHSWALVAEVGASTGASVGLRLAGGGLSGEDWAQIAASGAVSALRAWHRGAQMDATEAEGAYGPKDKSVACGAKGAPKCGDPASRGARLTAEQKKLDAYAKTLLEEHPDPMETEPVRELARTREFGAGILRGKNGDLRFSTITSADPQSPNHIKFDMRINEGETAVGLVHTHPISGDRFSGTDLNTAKDFFKADPEFFGSYILVPPEQRGQPYRTYVFEPKLNVITEVP